MKKVFLVLNIPLVLVACTRSNSGSSGGSHPAPLVTTDPVTAITTSAVSGGIVMGNDSTALTSRGVQWATDSNFTSPQTANANSAVNFSATMSPLSPGTTYYARAFATNAGGTGYGNTVEFTNNGASSDYTVSTYATFPDSTDLPMGVALGPGGIMYACGNGGQVWTIAANGSVGLLTDLGLELREIVADVRGNCYVLTQVDDIRRITPAGVVSVFAGGAHGQVDGIGTAAGFTGLQVADIDSTGNLYVGDMLSVRKVDTAGRVTTLYTFTSSNLVLSGIAVDKAHNIYFSTAEAVYRVDSLGRDLTYIAGKNGSADGTGIGAGFSGVFELRVNKDGNLVAADENKIRLITPAGVVTTLAGTAAIGFQDGDGNVAAFRFAVGLVIDSGGAMYVADDANARIRKVVHK